MEITLSDFQERAVFSPSRFVALIAGIQGGKTFAGCIWSRMQFDKYPQEDGMICAPTYKILSQSTLPKFFEINKDLKQYHKESKGTIEAPGKGIIYLRSTENPNVLEGMTLRWIWPDEAGQMKLQAWINMQGRVSILKGNIFLTTTPYAINWLRTDFYEQWKKGNKDYDVIQFKSIDNPYFPKEEFDRVQQTMDRRVFERRYCGLFTKMEGLVYQDFNYNTHVSDKIPDNFDVVIAGEDWGFKAPACILIIGIKDNVFYIIDEFYGEGKITDELLTIFKKFQDKWGLELLGKKHIPLYPDPAEQDRIEQFKRGGVEVRNSNNDVTFGIDKIQQLIREKRLVVHPRCKFFLEEIEMYHYPEFKENKEIKENPVKVDDHAMDAMRYPIVTFLTQNKISFARIEGDRKSYSPVLDIEPVPPIVIESKAMTNKQKEEEIRKLDRELIEASERDRIGQV